MSRFSFAQTTEDADSTSNTAAAGKATVLGSIGQQVRETRDTRRMMPSVDCVTNVPRSLRIIRQPMVHIIAKFHATGGDCRETEFEFEIDGKIAGAAGAVLDGMAKSASAGQAGVAIGQARLSCG